MGFIMKFMESGGEVYLTNFIAAVEIAKGQVCSIDGNGKAVLAQAGDVTMFGVSANDAQINGRVRLYPPNAVYGIGDPYERHCGDVLDLNTFSNGVEAANQVDFVVIRNCPVDQLTLVQLHFSSNIYFSGDSSS